MCMELQLHVTAQMAKVSVIILPSHLWETDPGGNEASHSPSILCPFKSITSGMAFLTAISTGNNEFSPGTAATW